MAALACFTVFCSPSVSPSLHYMALLTLFPSHASFHAQPQH